MRPVTQADLGEVRNILGRAPHLAMFPLSNLANYGLEGPADYAPFMWIGGDDVLTITRGGMVMPYLPSGEVEPAAAVLKGREVIGVIGEARAARRLMDVAGLAGLSATLDRDEPQFVLDIDRMIMPAVSGDLVPLQDAPRDLMEQWRVDYDCEALGSSPQAARARVSAEVSKYIENDSHRVLIVGGEPVCTTGFNARLPDIVQIGGVYTPPALRGRGYARRAVALHLAEAATLGVRRATLFASGAAAVRAYVSIGFERVGDWTITLFDGPQVADV